MMRETAVCEDSEQVPSCREGKDGLRWWRVALMREEDLEE